MRDGRHHAKGSLQRCSAFGADASIHQHMVPTKAQTKEPAAAKNTKYARVSKSHPANQSTYGKRGKAGAYKAAAQAAGPEAIHFPLHFRFSFPGAADSRRRFSSIKAMVSRCWRRLSAGASFVSKSQHRPPVFAR